jgi:hypothetical protein
MLTYEYGIFKNIFIWWKRALHMQLLLVVLKSRSVLFVSFANCLPRFSFPFAKKKQRKCMHGDETKSSDESASPPFIRFHDCWAMSRAWPGLQRKTTNRPKFFSFPNKKKNNYGAHGKLITRTTSLLGHACLPVSPFFCRGDRPVSPLITMSSDLTVAHGI